ncbi:uracil-DNA glycosylase family protein [Herbaspirillum sp. RTI4]|uniref:uracil-DNA glycosylase family protein n=1 Tax=Herbaspirillum sp. RTI4 TaxID=3048640 RepID=UPI002AB4F176|nr:uracil-DNA glycosylase family protein [Herbaspirillum sp. RTI4]MDY7577897.1 uracil-DNA glycosylase family protein [Herbaspirillum sp. RTI4]MEA9981657.1 uracil-DNA glycosylase family protein [Herbaspirillum sp. RTI4]
MASTIPFVQSATDTLLGQVRACTLCAAHLPQGVRPVLQVHADAQILIAGQAPGSKVHQSGIPFDDASGDRLRDWMGIDRDTFYNASRIAILPMGFCYPGTGKSGDLPPRKECAPAWRDQLLALMPKIKLVLVIGQYAQAWHLREACQPSLTENVRAWESFWPDMLPLPHPSPRNNIWLKQNDWFAGEVLPPLKDRVRRILEGSAE